MTQLPPPVPTQTPALGGITANDLAIAKLDWDRCREQHVAAQGKYNSWNSRLEADKRRQSRLKRRIAFRIWFGKLTVAVGRALDEYTSRVGGALIAAALVIALTFVIASQSGLNYFVAYGFVALFAILVGGSLYWAIRIPTDTVLNELATRAAEEVATTARTASATQAAFDAASRTMTTAQAKLSHVEQVFNSRLNRLLTCNWQVLTGTPFEDFLADVFEQLGYSVIRTGRTGDQGVDLIAARANRQLAVQAKGYVGHTVGNDAVQQAHTGTTFYRCHAAIVITTSTFTPAARECANRVGCMLIEGSQIPALIRGAVQLPS